MENVVENDPPGLRHLNLKKSFRPCVRSLLTAFPFEDFLKVFPRFTGGEREQLYQLYIQVITSLHENILDEFDSLCHETQVGTLLDTVEHLVEQQSLDPLSNQKSNLGDVKKDLLATKKNEILYLEDMLKKVEDEKRSATAQINLIKNKTVDTSISFDTVEKLRSVMAEYGSYSSEEV